jgi:transposase
MITSKQMAIYMKNKKTELTQKVAAAKADISERTGRRIDRGEHGLQKKTKHDWKTRPDPFADVWDKDIEPKLKQGVYEATFILEDLQKKYPGKYQNSTLRTLQRRIQVWRALFGKGKEVMFRQNHEPGKLGISDFTRPKKIKVTINGKPFEHIYYHFRLPYSGYNYMQVFMGSGEPYTAFAEGLQGALFDLGGVPENHRTDSLSASFKNLNKDAITDQTERYKALVEHYGMQATRNNPGKGHENGAVEASHRHIKNRIEQLLLIRESSDFTSIEEYREFIREATKQHNRQNTKNIEVERASLRQLPATKAADYTEAVAVVSCTSTIEIKRVTYSVPSRLIGERLHVRLYNDKLECYLGAAHAITLARTLRPAHGQRGYQIDYRHIIESLVRKPGAFQGSKLREAILPNENYRRIWNHVNGTMSNKDAGKFIVGVLYLAETQNCESDLAHAIIKLIEAGSPLQLSELQNRFTKSKPSIDAINVPQHTLSSYNEFIPNLQGAQQ